MSATRTATFFLAAFAAGLALASGAPDRLYLPVDPDAETTFKRLRELGARGQWDRVVTGLDALLRSGGDRLLKIQGGYRSVREEARRRLQSLRGDGRAAYDLIHAEEAERLLATGLVHEGTAEFQRILAEHPASRSVHRARELLVDRLIERGAPAAALPHIARLLEMSSDAEERTHLRRLRVLVLTLSGRRSEALVALDALADKDADASLALRARVDAFSAAPPRLPADPSALSWSQEVFGYYEISTQGSRPWSLPAADDATAYVHDGSHAMAVDLRTGKLIWRTPLQAEDAFRRPDGLCPLALGPGVVLCVLPGARGLVALDRAGGRVLWRRDLEGIKEEAKVDFQAHLATTAPPQIAGGIAAVALVTDHQDREVHLLGVDLFSGELAWSVFVASETTSETPYPVLTEEDGRFFVTTGHGVVAAVDAAGEVLWVGTYPSKRDDRDPRRGGQGRRAFPFRGRVAKPDRQPPTQAPTLLVANGVLWSSAADGKSLMAFDAATGARRGEVPLAQARLIAPRGQGVLVLHQGALHAVTRAGSKRLATIDAALDARAALAGDTLFVASARGVAAVDLKSGESSLLGPWRHSKGPGNLAVAGGRLLVAAPRGLYAYGESAGPPAALKESQLARALGDERFEVREAAVAQLLALHEAARATLVAAQESSDPEVAMRASRVLGELRRSKLLARWKPLIKPAWEQRIVDLLNRLSHPNPTRRLEVIVELGGIEDDEDVGVLMEDLLEDDDRRVAFAVAGALLARDRKNRKGVPHLVRALKDGSPAERVQAATWLTLYGADDDFEVLASALKDDDAGVRGAAIAGVFKHGRERCLPLVKPLLAAKDVSVRQAVIDGLVNAVTPPKDKQARARWIPMDPAAAMDLWGLAARDANGVIRGKAISQIARVGLRTPAALGILGGALGDAVRETAREAAKALYSAVQSDDALLIPADGIEKGSLSKDAFQRGWVAQIAIRYADKGGALSIPTLARFMSDPNWEIRSYVLDPGRIGWDELLLDRVQQVSCTASDMRALSDLTLFLNKEDEAGAARIRRRAYRILHDAADAPGRGELLAQGLADAEDSVRQACADWLRPIGQGDPDLLTPAAVREVLKTALRSTRPEGKEVAAKLLAELSPRHLFPGLLPLLTDPKAQEDMREAARVRLAGCSDGELTFDARADPAASRRSFATWWWSREHPGLTPEQLLLNLGSANPSIRWRAAQQACGLPLPDVRDALIRSTEGETQLWVLKAKLKALVQITGKRRGFEEKGKLADLQACAARFRAWLAEGGGGDRGR